MKKPYHFVLLGQNVDYSRSPEIFEAIFKQVERPGVFEIHSVSSEDLEHSLHQLTLDGVRGFSVTIPYKQSIVEHLDDIDPVAFALQAVNSICVHEYKLFGYNTDCFGFYHPLRLHRRKITKGHPLIIGNGGSARAVIYALYKNAASREFTVIGRSKTKLKNLKDQLEGNLENLQINILTGIEAIKAAPKKFSMIVNCTPLGGWHHSDESPLPKNFDYSLSKIYYDLNYNPESLPINQAREAGLTTIDGSMMLTAQAVRSFDIWTGKSVDIDLIHQEVFTKATA